LGVRTNTELVLGILFFFISMLYSSVGLGGGSSYTALMSMFGVQYEFIPTTSLTLNLAVTSVAVLNFWRRRHVNVKLIFPFLLTSIPMSFGGGALHLSERMFIWLLLVTLVFVAIRIYIWNNLTLRVNISPTKSIILSLVLGALLGFVAGTVGIGGGIYLVPLIILFRLAQEKEAAAAGAVFIWMNSLAGIVSRTQQGFFSSEIIFPAIGTVLVGGFIGSYFGSARFSPRTIQKTLGVVILIAIIYLLRKLILGVQS